MHKFRNFIYNFGIHAFLIIIALSCIFPLLWMISSALKTQATVFKDMSFISAEGAHWENFAIAWSKGGFNINFLNSLIYTSFVVAGIVFISSLAAFGFSRLDFPFKDTIFFMFLAAMMIPLPGSFVPLYVLLVKLGLVNTRIGYCFSMINVGLSLSIYLLKTFFDKLPRDLEDAARIDGCSRIGILWNVAFPLARPAIGIVMIFNTLNVWNEYILALIILQTKNLMPLQRGLMVFQGQHITEYPLLMAGITITILPIIVAYLFMQKFIIKGLTTGALV